MISLWLHPTDDVATQLNGCANQRSLSFKLLQIANTNKFAAEKNTKTKWRKMRAISIAMIAHTYVQYVSRAGFYAMISPNRNTERAPYAMSTYQWHISSMISSIHLECSQNNFVFLLLYYTCGFCALSSHIQIVGKSIFRSAAIPGRGEEREREWIIDERFAYIDIRYVWPSSLSFLFTFFLSISNQTHTDAKKNEISNDRHIEHIGMICSDVWFYERTFGKATDDDDTHKCYRSYVVKRLVLHNLCMHEYLIKFRGERVSEWVCVCVYIICEMANIGPVQVQHTFAWTIRCIQKKTVRRLVFSRIFFQREKYK